MGVRAADLVFKDKEMVAIRWLNLPTRIGRFKDKRFYTPEDAQSLAFSLRSLADRIEVTINDINDHIPDNVSFDACRAGFKEE